MGELKNIEVSILELLSHNKKNLTFKPIYKRKAGLWNSVEKSKSQVVEKSWKSSGPISEGQLSDMEDGTKMRAIDVESQSD